MGTTESEMVGWHHGLNGHEVKQALGVGDGQGSLVCCSPWGHKELDMTERLNRKKIRWYLRDFLTYLIEYLLILLVANWVICIEQLFSRVSVSFELRF